MIGEKLLAIIMQGKTWDNKSIERYNWINNEFFRWVVSKIRIAFVIAKLWNENGTLRRRRWNRSTSNSRLSIVFKVLGIKRQDHKMSSSFTTNYSLFCSGWNKLPQSQSRIKGTYLIKALQHPYIYPTNKIILPFHITYPFTPSNYASAAMVAWHESISVGYALWCSFIL